MQDQPSQHCIGWQKEVTGEGGLEEGAWREAGEGGEQERKHCQRKGGADEGEEQHRQLRRSAPGGMFEREADGMGGSRSMGGGMQD